MHCTADMADTNSLLETNENKEIQNSAKSEPCLGETNAAGQAGSTCVIGLGKVVR